MAKREAPRGLVSIYGCFGPSSFREQRMRAYIVRQHRDGRPLEEILGDRYLERLGTFGTRWRVVMNQLTIAAFRADIAAQIRACRPTVSPSDSHDSGRDC